MQPEHKVRLTLLASGIAQSYNRRKLSFLLSFWSSTFFLVQRLVYCSRICFLLCIQLLFNKLKCCSWTISVCSIIWHHAVIGSVGAVRRSISKVWTMYLEVCYMSIWDGFPQTWWTQPSYLCSYPWGPLPVAMSHWEDL